MCVFVHAKNTYSLSTEKKIENLKVENYVLFSGHVKDLSPKDNLTDN